MTGLARASRTCRSKRGPAVPVCIELTLRNRLRVVRGALHGGSQPAPLSGLLANMATAIRMVCADPESVIATLDADDALIGDRVLERLAAEYERGRVQGHQVQPEAALR